MLLERQKVGFRQAFYIQVGDLNDVAFIAAHISHKLIEGTTVCGL